MSTKKRAPIEAVARVRIALRAEDVRALLVRLPRCAFCTARSIARRERGIALHRIVGSGLFACSVCVRDQKDHARHPVVVEDLDHARAVRQLLGALDVERGAHVVDVLLVDDEPRKVH